MDDDIQELDISFLDLAAHNGEVDDDEYMDDELSEEDEELEEEEDLKTHRGLEGPTSWEAVDTVELEKVGLRVTAAAMPSADNKDMGTRIALQAAALEAENYDLLGLGRIDPRHLRLMRADTAKKVFTSGAMGATSKRRSGKRSTVEQAAISEAAGGARRQQLVTESNIAELRSKALPNSESFDPEVYLGTIHAGSTLPELLRGRKNLDHDVEERTGQLKVLVKENFDRFISCKNTIDDIHKRLRKSEAHDSLSASGNSTSDMVIAISEIQDEAKRAFSELLERASTSDQVKSVVALLKRYEGLFQLPSRIRQSTGRGDFDQVISEYKQARSLMDGMGAPNAKSVWHKLFAEVEKVVSEMVMLLETRLRDPETPQSVAIDAMRCILQLQAEKASSTQGMEPVNIYVQARNQYLRQQIEECMDRHRLHLHRLRERSDFEGAGLWKPPTNALQEEVISMFRSAAPSPWQKQTDVTAWLSLVRDLVPTVASSLPDFWHVPQDKLNQLKAVPGASKVVVAAVDEALLMAQDILRSFATKLHVALKELITEGDTSNCFLSAVSEIVQAFISFEATNTPPFVNDTLQNLLESATALAIERLTYRIRGAMQQMADNEDFEIIAISHKAGQPASKMPGLLRDLVSSSMQQLNSIMEEGCKADTNNYAFNPVGKHAAALRSAFFGCFTSYAVATDKLWAGVSSKADPKATDGLSRDTKLLVLHSNCVHVRTQVLKDLSGRYNDLLTNDGAMREAEELQSECTEDISAVEGRLASIYIEAHESLLNDLLREYFDDDGTEWSQTPIPTGLRDCTYEVIHALVAVQAEAYGNALSLQRRVMDELLQHFFAAYVAELGEKLAELEVGGALQLMIEAQYFSRALKSVLRPPRDAMLEQAKTMLAKRLDQLAAANRGGAEQVLDDWCETIQGGSIGGRAEMVAGFVSANIIKATRMNVACFKA